MKTGLKSTRMPAEKEQRRTGVCPILREETTVFIEAGDRLDTGIQGWRFLAAGSLYNLAAFPPPICSHMFQNSDCLAVVFF